MTVRCLPVHALLHLERRVVDVAIDRTYSEIGVRSFGKGLFIKEPTPGVELGSKRVFAVHAGDLIVSNVFAWEGAVAVADDTHRGTIGSHRFMTWVPFDADEVDVKFLTHYFTSEIGLEQLRRASPGSAGRNRTLSIKNFENLRVPLPHIDEQRRIAAHLDGVKRALQPVENFDRLSAITAATQSIMERRLIAAGPLVRLKDIADINPKPIRLDPEADVAFVPMAAVSDRLGTVENAQRRARRELTSGYKQFVSGDVIFARITPCMQNGKTAIYRSQDLPVAYGSTEFHVIRTSDQQLADWLRFVLRSQWFISQASGAFTGTAGQQRVPADFLRQVRVPQPRHVLNATTQVAELEQLQLKALSCLERSANLRLALLPAARNEAFSALR